MRQLGSLVLSFLLLLASVSSVSATPFSYTISAQQSWTFSGIPVAVGSIAGGIDFTGAGSADGSTLSDVINDQHVFSSSSLVGPGFLALDASFEIFYHALQPGWSTITVNYQLQETGTVPVGGSLNAFASIGAISEGFGINQFQQI